MSEPTPSRLTLADVARLAGVGLATASRALNGATGVSPRTRQKVLEVARAHHYVISPAASGLAAGTTRRVGVVVPHLSRWFFGQVVEGLQSVLADADLDTVLYGVGNRADRQKFFERLPVRRNVDALVIVGFLLERHEWERLELLGVHIVAAGGQYGAYPSVSIDDLATGRVAVQHLVDLGHRRIATIEATDPDLDDQPRWRGVAYSQVMAENGLAVEPALRRETTWGSEQAAATMTAMLRHPVRPTAVYAHSDEVAMGAVRSIRHAGLAVPQDISVVGIDDHPVAELMELTTVHQDVAGQGMTAGQMVVDLLTTGTTESAAVVAPTRLVVRGSTAPPRTT